MKALVTTCARHLAGAIPRRGDSLCNAEIAVNAVVGSAPRKLHKHDHLACDFVVTTLARSQTSQPAIGALLKLGYEVVVRELPEAASSERAVTRECEGWG